MGLIGWLILVLSQLGPVVGQAPPACGSCRTRLAAHDTSALRCHGCVSRALNLAVYPAQHGRHGRGTPMNNPGSAAHDTSARPSPCAPLLDIRAGKGHVPGPTAGLLEKDAEASAVGSDTSWRRTRDGWERSSQWALRQKSRAPAVHPIVVGLLEILLACAALIGFSEAGDDRPRAKPRPACPPGQRRP